MSNGSASIRGVPDPDPQGCAVAALSEEQSHREHCAALEATLFLQPGRDDELVFELEAGQLRLRARRS